MMDYGWLSLLVALLLAIGPPSAQRNWLGGVTALSVTVLHSGDGYGSVVPMDSSNSPCRPLAAAPYYEPTKKSASACDGGLARRSGVAAAVRAEVEASGGSVVLIDAGSALLGSLYYLTYGPEVIATYYNMMDYDAVKLEVHDFTPGVAKIANFTSLLTHGGNATVVASNVVNLNNDSRFVLNADGAQVMPYALIPLAGSAGEVLGFVGTMAEGLASMFATPGEVDSTRELVAMRNTVAMLQNMGVNKIVASVSGASVVDDIVNEVPGIDVLIVLSQLYCGNSNLTSAANSAGPYPTVRVMPWRQPVLIVGTGVNNGKYLGRLDLEFDDYGVITSWQGEPILLNDSSPVDTVMQADIVLRQVKVDNAAGQTVGSSLIELAYEHKCMFGECTVGAWSVDAIRAQGKTQIAMANGGSMYGSISAGNITLGELQTALPLLNGEIYTYSLKGRYLWQALENSVKLVTNTDLNLSQGIGRFLQVSGLRVLYNPQEKVGWRIVDVMAETSSGVWERLRDDQDYTVTSFRWLGVIGGDDYKMISDNAQMLTPVGVTGSGAYLIALTPGVITHVNMGRLNTTSLSTRSCHTGNGSLCNGNGVCVLGQCQCYDPLSASSLCESGVSASSSLSAGGIVGIVVGCAVAAVCVLATAVFITALLTSFRKRPAQQEWLIDFDELEIGDLLGRGGYGEVYRGKWKGTGVAVKTISAENITREMKKNFIEETSIMSRLRHPNIVLFMAASSKPPLLCIVMEYMALGSLYDVRMIPSPLYSHS
jgi:5'-nucleotidase